jgi:hypothetical protein
VLVVCGTTLELERAILTILLFVGAENNDTNPHEVNYDEVNKTTQRMDEVLYREEIMWLPNPVYLGCRRGIVTPKYFQHKAAARARKNQVKRLRKDDG